MVETLQAQEEGTSWRIWIACRLRPLLAALRMLADCFPASMMAGVAFVVAEGRLLLRAGGPDIRIDYEVPPCEVLGGGECDGAVPIRDMVAVLAQMKSEFVGLGAGPMPVFQVAGGASRHRLKADSAEVLSPSHPVETACRVDVASTSFRVAPDLLLGMIRQAKATGAPSGQSADIPGVHVEYLSCAFYDGVEDEPGCLRWNWLDVASCDGTRLMSSRALCPRHVGGDDHAEGLIPMPVVPVVEGVLAQMLPDVPVLVAMSPALISLQGRTKWGELVSVHVKLAARSPYFPGPALSASRPLLVGRLETAAAVSRAVAFTGPRPPFVTLRVADGGTALDVSAICDGETRAGSTGLKDAWDGPACSVTLQTDHLEDALGGFTQETVAIRICTSVEAVQIIEEKEAGPDKQPVVTTLSLPRFPQAPRLPGT